MGASCCQSVHPAGSQKSRFRRGGIERHLRKRLNKYAQLFQVGRTIASELNFSNLFRTILDQACGLLEADRSSIFLIDEKREYLRAFVSLDLETDEFKIAKDKGIAGHVFCSKVPLLINKPYDHPLFNPEVDRKTGFTTRNIVSVPLISRSRDCIGTMQVLNKNRGDFGMDDLELLVYISHYCAAALENSFLYEELKANALAKEKALDHLSHELKTPLAVISAVLERVDTRIRAAGSPDLSSTLARGRRNVNRLLDLQEKVDDILCGGSIDLSRQYRLMLADIVDLIEESEENGAIGAKQLAQAMATRLERMHGARDIEFREIKLDRFLRNLCTRALAAASTRRIDLSAELEEGLCLRIPADVLEKACAGLLRNAIENTPDGGTVKLKINAIKNSIQIKFIDHGTGISREHQKLLFYGFFHTQDTALYSSRMPYAFNAGGTGTDLLRIRKFAERFGFEIDFTSTRCCHLSGDLDVCPGDTAACPVAWWGTAGRRVTARPPSCNRP